MSWFEAASIASLAKSAIKEAQKTIDKALDIQEEEDTTADTFSPVLSPVTKDLKEESESFFTHFGVPDTIQEANKSQSKDDSSNKLKKEAFVIGGGGGGRMVESLWGSFTGSFFDNSKNEIKGQDPNISSTQASSPFSSSTPAPPGTPSPSTTSVVATQPPRSLSTLGGPEDSPSQSYSTWKPEDSPRSYSSSIATLSPANTPQSPLEHNMLQSPFLQEINEADVELLGDGGVDGELFGGGGSKKDAGWEWGGWESSIMVVGNDKRDISNETSSVNSAPLNPSQSEDGLADDTFETEDRFDKTRLIVGNGDTDSATLTSTLTCTALTTSTLPRTTLPASSLSSTNPSGTSLSPSQMATSPATKACDSHVSVHSSRKLSSEMETSLVPVSEDVLSQGDASTSFVTSHIASSITSHITSSFTSLIGGMVDEKNNEATPETDTCATPSENPPSLDRGMESPDSIEVCDSSLASPVQPDSVSTEPQLRPHSLAVFPCDGDTSPDSIEVIGSLEVIQSPTPPSSIEVMSPHSTTHELSSPTTFEVTSAAADEPCPDQASHPFKTENSDAKNYVVEDVNSSVMLHPKNIPSVEDTGSAMLHKKPPRHSSPQDDTDSKAITRQPISSVSKTIHQDEVEGIGEVANLVATTPVHSKSINQLIEVSTTNETPVSVHITEATEVGTLSEESKESFHSSTTSSSTFTVVDTAEQTADKLLDISDSPQKTSSTFLLSSKPEDAEQDITQSMNAGEIRKKIDKVDRSPELKKAAVASPEEKGNLKRDEDHFATESSCSLSSAAMLEMSSRSESSTETVTASMDSQHMTWSDIVPIDSQSDCEGDSTAKIERGKEIGNSTVGIESGNSTAKIERDNSTAEVQSEQESQNSTAKLESENEIGNMTAKLEIETSPEEGGREMSPTSSDRSDAQKIGSSEHSSGDEVETATSSDIEVISSPSLDGGSSNGGRLPPLMTSRLWGPPPKGAHRLPFPHQGGAKRDGNGNGYHGGETVPSSMTASFTSISESEDLLQSPELLLQLEASRITQVLLQDINAREKGHRRNESTVSETSESSFSDPPSPEMEKLLKKVTLLTDILESRETKVLELSHANAALQDSNTILKSRLDELEGLSKGTENTENLREEFTQRLVTMERKFQQALREKELTKKQLEEYKLEASSRRSESELLREMADKDTTISELRKEGEKLSKQELSYSNIVKKLRAKERESDALIKEHSTKLFSLSSDLERLRKQLKAKEELERWQIERIRTLSVEKRESSSEMREIEGENAELAAKVDTLKEALGEAQKEITSLQQRVSARESHASALALSAEVSARQMVESALSEAKGKRDREVDGLHSQIRGLREQMETAEEDSNRKEHHQRREIQSLMQRLSEAESRSDEACLSVSAATRPLIREMEALRKRHLAQTEAWEETEQTCNHKLKEAQRQCIVSGKKEREAKEHLSSVLAEMASVQAKVSSLQVENAELTANLKIISGTKATLVEDKAKNSQQLEALKKSFADEIFELKHEREILEQQLEMERTAAGAEKKKSAAYQDHIKERDRRIAQLQLLSGSRDSFQQPAGGPDSRRSTPRSSPTTSLSHLSAIGGGPESQWGDEVFDPPYGGGWSGHRSNTGSLYETLRGNNAAVTVDALTSTLRQREGEVVHLQGELSRLECQKESLTRECLEFSVKSEEHSLRVREIEELREKYKSMEQRYNALLQMYGEKVEEVEELRLDLEDVKEMYKLQIDQLMQK